MAEPAHLESATAVSSPQRDIKIEVGLVVEGIDSPAQDEDNMNTSKETAGNADQNHSSSQPQNSTVATENGGAKSQSLGSTHSSPSQNTNPFTASQSEGAKRPNEQGSEDFSPEAKRVKIETQTDNAAAGGDPSFEDGLALLVQNALSDANTMMDQAHDGSHVGENVAQSLETAGPQPGPESTTHIPSASPTPIRLPTTPPPPSISFEQEPEKFVRISGMTPLGHLATALLLIICQEQSEEIVPKLRNFNTAHAPSFIQLRVAFEAVRGLVSNEPAISADALGMEDPVARNIIEFVNMARLAIWLVDGGNKSLAAADKHFLSLFGCQVCDLPLGMTDLFIGIKTQRAFEAMSAKESDRTPEDLAREFLTNGLEDTLKSRHQGTDLTKADEDLVSSAQSRQEELVNQPATELSALKEKYPVEDLIRNFSTYIKGRLSTATELGKKLGIALPVSEPSMTEELVEEPVEAENADDMELDELSQFFEKSTSDLVQSALAGFVTAEDSAVGEEAIAAANSSAVSQAEAGNDAANNYSTDYQSLEALVAQSTSDYVKNTLDGLTPTRYQPTVPPSTAETMAAASNNHPYTNYTQQHGQQYYHFPQQSLSEQQQQQQQQQTPQQHPHQQQAAQQQSGGGGSNLPPNQTFPSEILYDKARQAALSKTSSHTRREGLHSTRRPWNQEEEKALMAGLDMVKGPHWSQILTLFGPSGTISDILKDRTQVQLKDKARNLKLFFLKTNSEMPYYLQAVTGELKTRAPTQAARKEAEELARANLEEEQAKLQGIMTLAGGLQHPAQNRKPAVSVRPGVHSVVTPAQAASAAVQAANKQRQATLPTTKPVTPSASTSSPAGFLALNGQSGQAQPRPAVHGQISHSVQSASQPPARPPSSLLFAGQRAQNQSIAQAAQARSAAIANVALSHTPTHSSTSQLHENLGQQPSQQTLAQSPPATRQPTSGATASSPSVPTAPKVMPAEQATAETASPSESRQALPSTVASQPVEHTAQQLQPSSNHIQNDGQSTPNSNLADTGLGPISTLKHEDGHADEETLLKGLQNAIQEATATS